MQRNAEIGFFTDLSKNKAKKRPQFASAAGRYSQVGPRRIGLSRKGGR
jgi:hypothetical protein